MKAVSLNRYTGPLQSFWSARNPRERRLLGIGLTVAVLGLLYLLLIDPALQGREQLHKSLPALRQQVAELRVLAQEAEALPEQTDSAATDIPPLTRASVEAALQSQGLTPENLSVGAGTVRVQLASISFASLVAWLDAVQSTLGVAVSEANIVAQSQADMVDATLTLQKRNNE